jgi:hypothetical protein
MDGVMVLGTDVRDAAGVHPGTRARPPDPAPSDRTSNIKDEGRRCGESA